MSDSAVFGQRNCCKVGFTFEVIWLGEGITPIDGIERPGRRKYTWQRRLSILDIILRYWQEILHQIWMGEVKGWGLGVWEVHCGMIVLGVLFHLV